MNVSFVHCTPDAEQLVARMARVSNPANADNHETAPRLIRYLISHKHWSPLEMASLCVRIETERDIAAQILRHRSFSFQEFSTRYAKTDRPEAPAFRRQDEKNRQASHDDLPKRDQLLYRSAAEKVLSDTFDMYELLLAQGVARETARRILPLCTPTVLFMHGTLRSWVHYLQLRMGPETQLEHRQVAEGCYAIFQEQFPTIAEAAFDV